MKRTLGHIQECVLDITGPVPMNFNMNFNQLVMLIGQNGTGKTFILKLNWIFTTLITLKLQAQSMKMAFNDNQSLQYLIDHSFDDRCLDGHIEFNFEHGDSVTAKFEKGIVKTVDFLLDPKITVGVQPIFMSKETRLLSDIIKYVKFKKLVVVPEGLPVIEEEMNKLLELYKLYDVIYMESLLYRIEHETTPKVIQTFNERIKNFDEHFSIQDIKVDYLTQDILYTDDKSVTKSVSTLGAGHQSLMNMILYQSY